MKIFTSISEWQTFRNKLEQSPMGFVPTMGALHEGHLSLVKASTQNNAFTIVSVFINPTQFDEQSDFEKYPNDHHSDLQRLKDSGVDAVLLPDANQIYRDEYRFKVTEDDFSPFS